MYQVDLSHFITKCDWIPKIQINKILALIDVIVIGNKLRTTPYKQKFSSLISFKKIKLN